MNAPAPAEMFSALQDLSAALKEASEAVELLITSIPTGELRNSLTDANIHILTAHGILQHLKEASL